MVDSLRGNRQDYLSQRGNESESQQLSATIQADWLASTNDVEQQLNRSNTKLLDARPKRSFLEKSGTVPQQSQEQFLEPMTLTTSSGFAPEDLCWKPQNDCRHWYSKMDWIKRK